MIIRIYSSLGGPPVLRLRLHCELECWTVLVSLVSLVTAAGLLCLCLCEM